MSAATAEAELSLLQRIGEGSAVIACATLGEYSLLIMPFIVTAMMQGFSLSEVRAGDLVSVQLLSMGVAGSAVSYLVTRMSRRMLVAIGAVLIMVANALCAFGSVEPALWAGRALTGVGEGTLMAAAGALAAGSPNPHRIFAILGLVIAVVATIALFGTPLLLDRLGPRGVFWLLAASPAVALIALWHLPAAKAPVTDYPRLGAIAVPGALAAMSAFSLLWVGAGALFVYAERIGTAHGLSLSQVGSCLAVGQVVGIGGPLLAARLTHRTLRMGLLGGSAVMAAAGLMFVYGDSGFSYALGASLLSLGAMFLAPSFRSLMAQLDDSGGVVAMSVPFYTLGFGVAPLIVGGLLALKTGYVGVAWLAAGAFALSGGLATLAPRQGVKTTRKRALPLSIR